MGKPTGKPPAKTKRGRKTAQPGLSKSEIARKFGVSATHISNLTLRGDLPMNKDGTVDPDVAARVLADRALKRAAGGAGTVVNLAEAQRRKEMAVAQLRELELETKAEQLVDADAVRRRVFALARADRDAWLNWPARIGPVLAARFGIDPHALTVELEEHVRRHLADRAAAPSLDLAGRGSGRSGLVGRADARPAADGVGVG